YVPNPLTPAEKKKVSLIVGISAVVLAVILGTTIPAGIFTLEVFITLVGIFGIAIPTIYFVVMYRSPKTTSDERSRIIAYIPL
ncbi:MFS transporter, partial [Mycobacterium tuberculosis]|nr:MFS transporter [Mycobacterium tuberculosis]